MARLCLIPVVLLVLSSPLPALDIMIESHEVPMVANSGGWFRQNSSLVPWTPFDSTRQYWDLTGYPAGRFLRIGLAAASQGRPPAPDSMANDPPASDICEFDTSGTGAILWHYLYKTNFGTYLDGTDFDNVFRYLGNYHPDYPVYLTPVYFGGSWSASIFWVCDTAEVPYMANEKHNKRVLARGKVKVPMSAPYYWPCLVARDSMSFNDEWDTRYTRWTYEWLVPGVFLGANGVAAAWSPRGAPPNFAYVEDMFVLGSASIPGWDAIPPAFANVRVWPDTNYAGPFAVWTDITDNQAVGAESVFYRVNQGVWHASRADSAAGSRYYFTVPQVSSPATIDYYFWAKDTFSVNRNIDLWTTWPVCAPESASIRFSVSGVDLTEPDDGLTTISPVSVSPNPFRTTTSLRGLTPGARLLRIEVYSAGGVRVRTLFLSNRADESGSVSWNGRDDDGRELEPGAYYCRTQEDGRRVSCKLVLLGGTARGH